MMVVLSLKICVRQCNVVKTMQFEPSTAVYDSCRVIRERVPEAQTGQASEYGLFLSDEDPRKGIWLEGGRTLDYYMLRNGDILEYKKKQRPQKIKMLDGAVKTIMVDDSKTVGELLVTICSRIGQQCFCHINWLDHGRTFREQGVEESETLLLRRKFFYSDQNVDSRDPVQLNLLYVQARDDILNGSHPVSFDKACEFGGIQSQIQFGPHIEHKHKSGFLDLKEFLPKEYIKQRGAEKKIFQEHNACGEMTEIEAKVKYVKLARSLRTYGVSFFLVKEKMKSKNKLVLRLLGITKESVMRVDEKTKDVVQEWPLTTVKRWAASPKSFTLDFGEYQESYYSVQTTEGEQISQLIAGYIDIILKKKQSKDHFGLEGDEEATMLEESVSPKKSTILQQQFNRVGRAEHGSVALPGILRSGSVGPETLNMGTMPSPQQQITTGQMHLGHMPPLVSLHIRMLILDLLSAAQQALVGTINTSMQAVQQAQSDLEEVEELPPLGDDMVRKLVKMDRSVEGCVKACLSATSDGELLKAISAAAGIATQALSDLLTHVRNYATRGETIGRYNEATDTIMTVTESIFSSMGDAGKMSASYTLPFNSLDKCRKKPTDSIVRPNLFSLPSSSVLCNSRDLLFFSIGEMVRQARVLAQATSDLVNAMRSDAEVEVDVNNSKKLLAAAKLLADATARMVEAAKGAAAYPENEDQQQKLREAAEGLRVATNAAAQNAIKKKLITRLENAAKQAAAAATQTIAASQNAAASNKNTVAHQQLVQSCRAVADHIPQLVQGVRGSQGQPEDGSAQLALIIASQNFLQPGSKMVSSAKSSVPTVTDQAAAMQLGQCAKNLATCLAELRTAAQMAHEACGPMEIDSAVIAVQTLKNELHDAKMAASEGQLKPLPGESLEKCTQDLGGTSKAVGSSMAQLLTCAAQGNEHYTGVVASETAQALKTLAQAARGVAATSSDPAGAAAMLDSAREVMEGSAKLISEAKEALVAKAVSHSLNACVNCLPGQKDVDMALKSIGEASKKLLVETLPPCSKTFQEAQSDLNQTAADLNQSAGDVVHASRGTTSQLADASGKFSEDFDEFLDAGIEMAGHTQRRDDQMQVIGNLKNISMASSKLLLAAKSLSVDPAAGNAKNLLAAAARTVTDSINQLITLCTQNAPGQRECDNALRELKAVRGLLDNPNEPVNDLSYFDCIEKVMENSKILGESMAGIFHNCKTGDVPAFGDCVGGASKALCGLTEAAGQAAYLVGVSDPNSQAGHPGLVDPIQFTRANQAIQMACQNLVDPDSSPSQVLSAATIVAKHTSALCNACRLASSKTANPVAKRHFVQSAKEVANSTANLVKTIKALDGDFSEENREKCHVATAPLTEAVDNLTTFASNPEFASVPAQISREGSVAQEPIIQSARAMLDSSTHLLKTARSLVINPKDPPTWSLLASHSRTVSDSIKSLITAIRDKAPGQKECDSAIDNINKCIRDIEQASLAAVSQNLSRRDEVSSEALQEQLTSSVQEVGHLIEPISTAAKGEAAQLGHKVSQLVSYFTPLVSASMGMASKILDHQQQMNLLDQTKTLAESALQMLYAAKEGGGNPKVAHTHDAIAEAAQLMREAVDDLLLTLNEAASEVGMVGGMVDLIADAMGKLGEGTSPEPEGSFVEYQTTMVRYSKAIAVSAQEMITKSVSAPEDLGSLASHVTADYSQLAVQGRLAAATAEPEEIGFQIKTRVQELGHGCIVLVQKAGALQICPSDSFTKRELIECARAVTEKVSMVLSALQAGNKGTQACITAASAVSGIIADLDTTIMFASAGTLNAENDSDSFADHRENILKTAKALVEDTKNLVSGAASSQEKLAQAAQSSAKTITQLTDVVKLGAASIGPDDPETQVVLINAVKDVAKALAELISATKCAAGKAADDPSMFQLKSAAKVMVTNVTSLLKTVKAVEDEASRGTRALEATIECIKQELTVFQSKEAPEKLTTPEEFIRMTKGITTATAKAVAAGNSARQEDVISTANLSRKVIADMLTTCKQAAYHEEVSEEVRSRALLYGTECTNGYIELLEHVLQVLQKPTGDQKQKLAMFSKKVAAAVTELIQTAEAMKGTEWVDPEDPTVIAETELLGAAASIEAAAKKLEQLKPRAKPKQADENLDFEEQILEAAKSIAAATSALVKSASAAQRELVAQGKVGAIPANALDDGQWSQGLISAARMVAAATSNLCEAANASVQGHASEEKLISSAKQVAASTAQLLVACKVKAEQDSEAMRRLQAAGNAVKRASDSLVRAAQKAAFNKADNHNVVVKTRFVGGIAQIIAAQEEMLRKERELEEARKKLAQIRQQQYKFLPSELREDED
uniref:Talin-2-like n=1 Tax=Sinocyclocheilus grahami TaxID=75366 RepID=A0A672PCY1_SINGR